MGRRKTPERTMNDLLWGSRGKIQKVWDGIVASAVKGRKVTCPHCQTRFDVPGGGDLKAQMYIMDRAYGKASMTLSHELKNPPVTGDDLLQAAAAITTAVMQQEANLLGSGEINAEYEVIEDVDVDSESSNGDVSSGEGGTRPATDGGGEGVGSVESETSSSEEE